MAMDENNSQLINYQTIKGNIKLDVRLDDEMVWLTQAQMSELFTKNKRTVSEHIKNIFKEGELKEKKAVRNIRISAPDGKVYKTNHYNFDVIISVGYRVKSPQITPFRYWVQEQLENTVPSSGNDDFTKVELVNNLDEILEDINKLSVGIKKSTFKKMKF